MSIGAPVGGHRHDGFSLNGFSFNGYPWRFYAVCLAKALRTGAFGATSVILAQYLIRAHFNTGELGGLLSATLVEDAILTTVVAALAPRLGHKRILLVSSLAMAASGLALCLGGGAAASKVFIVTAIIFGIISPAGYEGGPFGPIEQTIIAGSCSADEQGSIIKSSGGSGNASTTSARLTRALSIYNLMGFGGAALGAYLAGLWAASGTDAAYAQIFAAYGVIGLATFILYATTGDAGQTMPERSPPDSPRADSRADSASSSQAHSIDKLIDSSRIDRTRKDSSSKNSSSNIGWLAGLQSLDAFGGGFVVQSLVSFWFVTRFQADTAFIGTIFFWANIFAALSFFAAPALAKRFGLLNTMVFTHLPCSLAICLMPFMPTAAAAGGLMLLRSFFSSMDIPARQAYSLLLVPPERRPYAAALTTSSRAIAQGVSPALSGWTQSLVIMGPLAQGLPFIFAGVLKSVYDVAVYLKFKDIPLHRDEAVEALNEVEAVKPIEANDTAATIETVQVDAKREEPLLVGTRR